MIERIVKKDSRGVTVAEYRDVTDSANPRTIEQKYLCASSVDGDDHEMDPNDLVVLVGVASGIAPPRPVSLVRLAALIDAECHRLLEIDVRRRAEADTKARAEADAKARLQQPRRIPDTEIK